MFYFKVDSAPAQFAISKYRPDMTFEWGVTCNQNDLCLSFQGEKIGGDIGKAFPLIIFGAISLLAGILTLFLPETLNTQMPENIEDAKLFGT